MLDNVSSKETANEKRPTPENEQNESFAAPKKYTKASKRQFVRPAETTIENRYKLLNDRKEDDSMEGTEESTQNNKLETPIN